VKGVLADAVARMFAPPSGTNEKRHAFSEDTLQRNVHASRFVASSLRVHVAHASAHQRGIPESPPATLAVRTIAPFSEQHPLGFEGVISPVNSHVHELQPAAGVRRKSTTVGS
jgi:hypothetical protein